MVIAALTDGDLEPAPYTLNRVLLSVFDKTGLGEFVEGLLSFKPDLELLASGGTAKFLQARGLKVTLIEDFTGARELLGGRVKTLHPKIYAGLLSDRRSKEHLQDLANGAYLPIDLVVSNLYPFAKVREAGGSTALCVENIDIGGPSLLRAAAKNVLGGTAVITNPEDYPTCLHWLQSQGELPFTFRAELALKAWELVRDYDEQIANFAKATWSPVKAKADAPLVKEARMGLGHLTVQTKLRYGENPEQEAYLCTLASEKRGVAHGTLLQGKVLSYNNFLDMDAAYNAVYPLSKPACALVKHTNTCGLAMQSSLSAAFTAALAADPLSAFGSIIGFNGLVDEELALTIKESKLFVECIVAPDFTAEALALFKPRENLRLFKVPPGDPFPAYQVHRLGGGLLLETTKALAFTTPASYTHWQVVSKRAPDPRTLEELAFSMHAAAGLKSNAIAVTKGQVLLGAGAGQMSRVAAVEQALKQAGTAAEGACLGSDAFFPFADSLQLARAAGISAIIEPGGSKRDAEVIAAADELGLCLVFTGSRYFKH